MGRYRCRRCERSFEAAEPRCPKCLRKSTVEVLEVGPLPSTPPPPPTPDPAPAAALGPGSGHVTANAVMMALLLGMHALMLASVGVNVILDALGEDALGGFAPSGPEEAAEKVGYYGAFACIGIFSLVGVLWTPLNAWGLWTRRTWARTSTMIYWATSLLTVCCIPVGLYGLWSLSREDVRAQLGRRG